MANPKPHEVDGVLIEVGEHFSSCRSHSPSGRAGWGLGTRNVYFDALRGIDRLYRPAGDSAGNRFREISPNGRKSIRCGPCSGPKGPSFST